MINIPENLEDAVQLIAERPGLSTPGIRNELGLWNPESVLRAHFAKTYGIAHPDDISAMIFRAVELQQAQLPYDPWAHAIRFHRYWSVLGMSSLEAGGWEARRKP